jgi:hypothetical protein
MPDLLTDADVSALMPELRAVMREAADIARPFFRLGGQTSARIWSKAGGSPVTEADVAVDAFLKVRLSALVPQAAWLSEETADDPARIGHDLVWIVDPIDGTRAFLSGHPDWSIAVALLAEGQPLIGFVHAPVGNADYEAVRGRGATRNGETIRVDARQSLAGARITGPKPMLDRLTRGAGPDPVPRPPPRPGCGRKRRCRDDLRPCQGLGPRRRGPGPAGGRRDRVRVQRRSDPLQSPRPGPWRAARRANGPARSGSDGLGPLRRLQVSGGAQAAVASRSFTAAGANPSRSARCQWSSRGE